MVGGERRRSGTARRRRSILGLALVARRARSPVWSPITRARSADSAGCSGLLLEWRRVVAERSGELLLGDRALADADDEVVGSIRLPIVELRIRSSRRNTTAAAKPVRLLPSMNGWFITMWNRYAAAISKMSSCRYVARTRPRAWPQPTRACPESRSPCEPPSQIDLDAREGTTTSSTVEEPDLGIVQVDEPVGDSAIRPVRSAPPSSRIDAPATADAGVIVSARPSVRSRDFGIIVASQQLEDRLVDDQRPAIPVLHELLAHRRRTSHRPHLHARA